MIQFNYETGFLLDDEQRYAEWISQIIVSEGKREGEINFIFCEDEYLLKINQQYLQHDDYTDIISFDYSIGNELNGDIFISVERVQENSVEFDVSFDEELRRVMAHGVLHYCGFKDKSSEDEAVMRKKENEKILMFHVEQ